MKQPETKLKERVLRDLKELPQTWCVKTQQVAIRGTPDILACICGWFVALELKRDDKQKADPLQDYHLAKIRQAGGNSFLVTPTNWPDIFQILRDLAGNELAS